MSASQHPSPSCVHSLWRQLVFIEIVVSVFGAQEDTASQVFSKAYPTIQRPSGSYCCVLAHLNTHCSELPAPVEWTPLYVHISYDPTLPAAPLLRAPVCGCSMCPAGWLVSPAASVASYSELSSSPCIPAQLVCIAHVSSLKALSGARWTEWVMCLSPGDQFWGSLFSSVDPCEIGPEIWTSLVQAVWSCCCH